MEIRRVIASSVGGKAVFACDEEVVAVRSPILENEIVRLWGFDDPPVIASDARTQPSSVSVFPPPGGMRVLVWTAPPLFGTLNHSPGDTERRRADEVLPGMAHVEVGDDGLHATSTVDIQVVLRGEIELVLDDGAGRSLRAGDTVVVTGARHAWRNHSDETCVLLAVFYGTAKA